MKKKLHLPAGVFFAVLGLSAWQASVAQSAGTRAAAAAGAQAGVKMGTYRAVLQTPGGDLPFGLQLVREGSQVVGYLLNGEERLPLHEVKVSGSHLEIRMPGYENALSADAAGNQLKGEVFLVKITPASLGLPPVSTILSS